MEFKINMTWFVFALICVICWGLADIFYKKGSDETDRYSHLKIAVWVGLVMGVCAIALLPFAESSFDVQSLIIKAVKYSPASLSYIISMVIGYAGLRYLELSIVSPIQNASGALSAICILLYMLATGRIGKISDALGFLDIIGTILIVVGVIALAFEEKKLAKEVAITDNRKYKYGAIALLFPLLYCIFDTIGTAADGIILNEESGMGLGEFDVIILYGLTFFVAGIICWIVILIKEKKPYNPFGKGQLFKGVAAVCEEGGQIFYVYAMAARPVLAAPMVASYCIVSVILSRIIIKEKLSKTQYACIIFVIAGIVILGISEGLG